MNTILTPAEVEVVAVACENFPPEKGEHWMSDGVP